MNDSSPSSTAEHALRLAQSRAVMTESRAEMEHARAMVEEARERSRVGLLAYEASLRRVRRSAERTGHQPPPG